jgi:hypothetical protein
MCALPFAGAVSAQQAPGDTITVTGKVTGTSPSGTDLQFIATGSPFKSISFSGGSNWHFTNVSGAAWTCSLTPTNGGAYCSSTTAATSYTINTTISGTVPTAVTGQVGYADASTGTFTAPVTTASECHCTHLSLELTHFKEEGTHTLVFFLRWRLHCITGTTHYCAGTISSGLDLEKELADHRLRLRLPPNSKKFHKYADGTFDVSCGQKVGHDTGCTNSEVEGRAEFEVLGPSELRRHLTLKWHLRLICNDIPKGISRHETLTIKFDEHGNLDRKDSHLGNLS